MKKTMKFKRVKKCKKKNIERACEVLQGCWKIIQQYACAYQVNVFKKSCKLLRSKFNLKGILLPLSIPSTPYSP